MRSILSLIALSAMLLAGGIRPVAAQTPVQWIVGPGTPDNWNDDDHWLGTSGNFIPSAEFDEIAVISNGGTAFVIDAPVQPGGVTVASGFLEIRGGGTLSTRVGDGGVANGAVIIGQGGTGRLTVFSNGVLNAPSLTSGGAADSEISLADTASLNIAGNASLQRVTRIAGPGVSFEVGGDLAVGGLFVPVITGATHSAIDVFSGEVTLAGVLQPRFSGAQPTLGQSWTLIDAASVNGQFQSIDSSQVPGLARGTEFSVAYNPGGSGNVVLGLDSKLILSVNRATGEASFENVIGSAKTIQGYSIRSAAGTLAPDTWSSLEEAGEGAWEEANPTVQALSELNPLGSSTLAVDASRDMGDILNFAPTSFGELLAEDIRFDYVTGDGVIVRGIVEYTGNVNTIALVVDPGTGEAALQNQSAFSADVQGYSIGSASGSLLTGGWNSLEEQGIGAWDEATPTEFNLSELNPLGSSLLSAGSVLNLGSPFDPAGDRDLTLSFLLTDGSILDGVVQYGQIPAAGQEGDTNGDGRVTLDDLNDVRNFFGNIGAPGIPGDSFPFDGSVDLDDLNAVRNNFGAGGSAAPEPGSLCLLAVACLGLTIAIPRRTGSPGSGPVKVGVTARN